MRKFFFGFLLLLSPVSAFAEFDTTESSFTIVGSTQSLVTISSNVYRIDGIAVTYPGVTSFVEIWDWKGSTGSGKYLGKYDTTSKIYFPFNSNYGLRITTGIVIHNQGGTPAGIRVDYRKNKP